MDDHRGVHAVLRGLTAPAARVRRAAPTDRGAVTAELAVALPAVVLVLVAVLAIALAGTTQLRVSDAARAGARAAAAGEPDARVREIADRTAGGDVSVVVRRADPWVTVAVDAPVAGSWFGGRGLSASATSTAWLESAVGQDGAVQDGAVHDGAAQEGAP